MKTHSRGILHLIPTPLHPGRVAPEVVRNLNGLIAESRKGALAFLRRAGVEQPSEFPIRLLNEHTNDRDIPDLIHPIENGETWGLISDAGSPAVADPGAPLVRLAHERKIRVVPLPGPSSIFMALMSSGLDGQRFVFHGYLSVKPEIRSRELKELEQDAIRNRRTQIWIETPYRNDAVLAAALDVLQDKTLLCVAAELTGPNEEIVLKPVAEWKREPMPVLKKRPAVFLLGHD